MTTEVKIYIRSNKSESGETIREQFWNTILYSNEARNKPKDSFSAEIKLLGLGSEIKRRIIRHFDNEIQSIVSSLYPHDRFFDRQIEKIFYERKDKELSEEQLIQILHRIRIEQASRSVSVSDNAEISKLIRKRIAASSLTFDIKNIRYGSLEFDLLAKPASSLLEICENNYELLEIFLSQFIFEAFKDEFVDYSNPIQLETKVEVTTKSIMGSLPSQISGLTTQNVNTQSMNTKSKLAQMIWVLSNTSLIVPFALSILIVMYYQYKIEKMQEIHDKRLELIFNRHDRLFNHYQDAITTNDSTKVH